jgi:antitoxin component YwqK of YwqJK toxin-antitoxin module
MQNNRLKTIFAACLFLFSTLHINAQYKQFSISAKGDTINAINQKGEKLGKWVISVPELRGEPGYEEEGLYKKGLKHGIWRKYNLEGDIIAVENYKNGGKDGLQQYFTYLGELVLEENWKGYDPDAPYDTIPVYGTGSGEIIDYKIVKAEQYSVKNGEWKFYEPGTGRLIKTEQWDRNNLVIPGGNKSTALVAKDSPPKKPEKTAQMLEWEKKNKGKKKVVRDGRTGL